MYANTCTRKFTRETVHYIYADTRAAHRVSMGAGVCMNSSAGISEDITHRAIEYD